MNNTLMLKLVIGLTSTTSFVFFLLFIYFYCKRRSTISHNSHSHDQYDHDHGDDIEKNNNNNNNNKKKKHEDEGELDEELVIFQGGEDLTICDILDAPGEVIGKSNYGTLYKAFLHNSSSVRLLRFLRPICATNGDEFDEVVRFLGCLRHHNLVPLLGFYAGSRGEKLLVHPFYRRGNLSLFIRDSSNNESQTWTTIHKISLGIARGVDHLHTGYQKPVIHGNLKSKNILLDRHFEPHISDSALHLLLNPTTGQEMLEALASQGYKAPELIKMKEASEPSSDIYSLGVVFLELITGKEPVNEKPTTPEEDFYLPDFLRTAVLGRRVTELFNPNILVNSSSDGGGDATEERVLKFFQLAMACCSPSPSLRPNIKQVVSKLEEIGK